MKKHLQKKFYASIIMIMFSIVSANAQINYTDVNPDVALNCSFTGGCSGNYSLDLNSDGMNDFILAVKKSGFSCSCNGGPHGGTNQLGENDSAVISSTLHSWIADTTGGYALNTLIDSSLVWTNANHTLAGSYGHCQACSFGGASLSWLPLSGPWKNINGKYLALKTQVGSNFYYGWVKLGVGVGNYSVSITIMEYAYNSIPNQPILAGQTIATGINENSFASSINFFPNPVNNHLTIAFGSNNKKVNATITDITGKIIYATTASETQKVEVNTEDFKAGIYVVQIHTSDFIVTKRLVVEK